MKRQKAIKEVYYRYIVYSIGTPDKGGCSSDKVVEAGNLVDTGERCLPWGRTTYEIVTNQHHGWELG